MLRVFVGWDSKQPVAFHVCSHSITKRSSIPVSVIPLRKEHLDRFFTRPRGPYDSTEFSITRFLVPFLSDYEGFSIYMDGDMVVLGDIAELTHYMTESNHYSTAVRVVKHSYAPKENTKFLNQPQTSYTKKNWSSVMIFNNRLCNKLTLPYVENCAGLDLHQFMWCAPLRVGEIPKRWNWLISEPGYDTLPEDVALLHYTKGLPCFDAYKDCAHADLWHKEYEDMISHG